MALPGLVVSAEINESLKLDSRLKDDLKTLSED